MKILMAFIALTIVFTTGVLVGWLKQPAVNLSVDKVQGLLLEGVFREAKRGYNFQLDIDGRRYEFTPRRDGALMVRRNVK